MSYAHCKVCYKTIHTSDLIKMGSQNKDCGICGLKATNVDVDTEEEYFSIQPKKGEFNHE